MAEFGLGGAQSFVTHTPVPVGNVKACALESPEWSRCPSHDGQKSGVATMLGYFHEDGKSLREFFILQLLKWS